MKLYGRKDVRVAAHNHKAARHFLDLAEAAQEGRFFTVKASLIFSAFTHEAFLNTLGARLIPYWSDLDRLPVTRKLAVICKHISYEPDLSRRPYQTLKGLFSFRNLVAHGRDETVYANGVVVPGPQAEVFYNPLNSISTTWEAYCVLENARSAVVDVREIASDLCARAGIERFPGYPFGNIQSGEFSYSHDDA